MIHVGNTDDRTRVFLSSHDLQTHVHALGASRKGKSKLAEYIVRQLVKTQKAFCLIDPHGELYGNLLQWLAYVRPKHDVILFNPSYEKRIVGFNPFTIADPTDEAKLSTKVDRMVAATLLAWGQTDANNTPRLERWLRTLYFTILEQGLSIDAARFFLSYEHKSVRDSIIAQIRSPAVREEWMNLLASSTKHGFVGRLESVGNRLQRFVAHPTIRRMMSVSTNSIDIEALTNGKHSLIANLQPSDLLSEDVARITGTLLLNEIWEVVRRRKVRGGKRPRDFFVIIDEFQNFATPDVSTMLDEGAKYGLHLILLHQRLSQLNADLQGAIKNAHTRCIFGGLPKGEAEEMLYGSKPSTPIAEPKEDVNATVMHSRQHFTLRRPEKRLEFVTTPLVEEYGLGSETVERYVAQKLARYLTVREVDALLDRMHRPDRSTIEPAESTIPVADNFNTAAPRSPSVPSKRPRVVSDPKPTPAASYSTQAIPLPTPSPVLGRGGRQHKYLQQLVKRMAEDKGYRVTIEKPILGGLGSVDVALERDTVTVACEISVTTTVDHEITNIEKCLAAEFTHVVLISPERRFLKTAKTLLVQALGEASVKRVRLFTPEDFLTFLEDLDKNAVHDVTSVRGYKVKVKYRVTSGDDQKARKEAIAHTVVQALRRLKN